MPLKVKPLNKLIYKLRLTPQMRMEINLLQMPLVKLREVIEHHLEENPVLELQGVKQPPSEDVPCAYSAEEGMPAENTDSGYAEDEDSRDYKTSLIVKPATLAEHLLKQLRLLAPSDDLLKIGEHLIGYIDEDGYLSCSLEEIAGTAQTGVKKVQQALCLIQTFDPAGVAARDIRESLLLQLQSRKRQDSLACRIVDKYLPDLEKKKYPLIAQGLGVSIQKVRDAIKEIARLEPKPGRRFNTEESVHLVPDAFLKKTSQGYEVQFNDTDLPRLTINKKYQNMIRQKDVPAAAREYLRERVAAARALIYAVKKRRQTIQKVIEAIVVLQNDFLDKGAGHLKPMTLSAVAKLAEKNKSTVSRTLSSKYLHTPWGIMELRYFLNSGIRQSDQTALSSKAVKGEIIKLIQGEKRIKPLSDREIAERLKQKGIGVARRTIAKYRHQLKILSSPSRKQ